MNAILREQCEEPVLTNDAIEVHLSYLRPAVEAVQTELPALRKEIKALDEKLSGKIDKLSERVLEMQGNQKGLILFLSCAALLASGVSIAHSLGWI
jgi:predicted nuclease with TOPRIM domain